MTSPTPYLDLEELTAIFNYKNVRAAKRAIKYDLFEVPTYRLAGRVVASTSIVKGFFNKKERDAAAQAPELVAPVVEEPDGFLDD